MKIGLFERAGAWQLALEKSHLGVAYAIDSDLVRAPYLRDRMRKDEWISMPAACHGFG